MTETEMIAWIDNATYEQLLRRWRFAAVGSPWFQGEVGGHYAKTMKRQREKVGPATHTRISKEIGWNQ